MQPRSSRDAAEIQAGVRVWPRASCDPPPALHAAPSLTLRRRACSPCEPTASPPFARRELKQLVHKGQEEWLLLVHDKGDLAVDHKSFGDILGATPPELVGERGAGGIYHTVCRL